MPFPENIIPDTYPTSVSSEFTIVSNASNLRFGDNPAYTIDDFVAMFTQFGPDANENYIVSQTMLQLYINLASASIQESRFHEYWQLCMGLFVAHFATLILEGIKQPGGTSASIIELGKAKGLRTSKSVGPISTSVDYSAIVQDLDGWASWKLTTFGQQLATISKLVGKGGMMVW